MSAYESRPKAAHESSTKTTTHSLDAGTDFTAEDRHAAFVAGYEQGKAERIETEIEDRMLTRLHEQARAALGMAKRYAAAKGPAWQAMIVWSGESDD